MPTTTEALGLIIFLMPGFIGAGVTSYLRNEPLSAINLAILAVLISLLANPIAMLFGVAVLGLKDITDRNLQAFAVTGYFVFASAVATAIGIVFGVIIQSAWLRRSLYKLVLTEEFALGSVREHVLREQQWQSATFHLRDGRRILGYVKYFTTAKEMEQFCIGGATIEAGNCPRYPSAATKGNSGPVERRDWLPAHLAEADAGGRPQARGVGHQPPR